MLENTKLKGGAVSKMLEITDHQEGQSLARCSKI